MVWKGIIKLDYSYLFFKFDWLDVNICNSGIEMYEYSLTLVNNNILLFSNEPFVRNSQVGHVIFLVEPGFLLVLMKSANLWGQFY